MVGVAGECGEVVGVARESGSVVGVARTPLESVCCRQRGGKSLVAVGRSGPRLLERSPTPFAYPLWCATFEAPHRLNAIERMRRRAS